MGNRLLESCVAVIFGATVSILLAGCGSTSVAPATTAVNPASSLTIGGAISPASDSAGTTVTLSGAASAATTADASGNYIFNGVSSGNYTVTPNQSGVVFTPLSQTVAINASSNASVNFHAGPKLKSLSITALRNSIAKGTTDQFAAIGTFSDGSTQDLTSSATWNSSNTAAFSFSSAGLGTGMAIGSSTITATQRGITSNAATVTVTAATLESITISSANSSIASGTNDQFTATGIFSDGTTQNLTAFVSWLSSNTTVATIGSSGLASGLAVGSCGVTATQNGITSNTLTLSVTTVTLQSIAITTSNTSIAKGTTDQFSATGTFSDGTTQNLTGSVAWNTSNASVVTISANGLTTGTGVGSSNITATQSGVASNTIALTVTLATLQSISVTASTASIAKGTTDQFSAVGTFSDGTTQNLTSSATWNSSNTAAAAINANGLAKGAGVGSSNIAAAQDGVTSNAIALTVTAAILQSIAIAATNSSIAKGTADQFGATGTFSDGTTQNLTNSVVWISSNAAAITITTSGLASGTGTGSSNVTASQNGITSNTIVLTVTAATLQSITITALNTSIANGTGEQFAATGAFSDGTTQNLTSSATWTSSNTAAATINTSGLAMGSGAGSTNISATQAGIASNTIALTVTAATLQSISISVSSISIAKGTSDQFTATGTFTDGTTQNLTSSANWTSSNTAAATISTAGLATGAAVGSSNITATQSGITSNVIALTVTTSSLVSITVTAPSTSLAPSASEQFSASGTYSDGTSQNLTSSATWNSSNPAAATISTTGLATAIAAGQTTISATQAGVTGSFVTSVSAPFAITTASVANGQVGQAYSASLSASGGTGAEFWSVSTGQLPAGLTLSSAGVISGTPTTQGNYIFSVQVADSSSPAQTASAALAISVLTPLNLAVSNAGFATPVVVGEVSTTPQVITVTNNTGSDVTFVVEKFSDTFPNQLGAIVETGAAIVQRVKGDTCQPRRTDTATLANGASCQFNVDLIPNAVGSVTGTVKLEYVPKPTNPIVSISRSGASQSVVTQNPVANLQVGAYVSIIGTPDDVCCNANILSDNYNDTLKVLSVTDSTHFTTADPGTPIVPVSNQGFISDAYTSYDAFNTVANVTGTGLAEPQFDATHPPALPLGIASDYSGTVMDTHYTAPAACTGSIIADGPTLTSRLASASCGDVLCVQAGTTISGNFTLPQINGCTTYTQLISSDYANSAFPAAGTRVQSTDEPHLGIIQASSTGPAIQTAFGAAYWRLTGLELTRVTNGAAAVYGPLSMGNGQATDATTIPNHIICDRCWIHRQESDPTEMVIGADMSGNYLAVIDSRIENIGVGEDTAAGNCNGNGPLKLVNNYLEASGETVIWGGCDPNWVGSYPQDIEMRLNYYTKRLAWKSLPGQGVTTNVKNLLEFKSGVRALVLDSIMEYNWINGQNGTALLVTPANQDGSNPTNRVQDITYNYIELRHATNGINLNSTSIYGLASGYTRRLLFKNMLLQDVGGGSSSPWVTTVPCDNSCGQFMNFGGQIGAKLGPMVPIKDVLMDHITDFSTALFFDFSGPQNGAVNIGVTNSLLWEGTYGGGGIIGSGVGAANTAINYFMVNPVFRTTTWIGNVNDAGYYPATDPSGSGSPAFWWEDVGTVGSNANLFSDSSNCNAGTYSIAACGLNPGSIYNAGGSRHASDGTQVGADITGLATRTACVMTGAACNPLP
jgi:hypothetical protein